MTRRVVCISHSKDVDGLSSAALVKMATNASVHLTDYGEILSILPTVKQGNDVYICDLGMNEAIAKGFLREVRRLSAKGEVTYIDHHPLSDSLRKSIADAGANVVNSPQECAGVHTYLHLKEKLPRRAALLACYAAVTDYMDQGAIARQLIGGFDRQFVLMESTMLAYAISYSGGNQDFLMKVVNSLAELKVPHQIEGVVEFAQRQAENINTLLQSIGKAGKNYNTFAYTESKEFSLGLVANLLIGEFQVPVGIALRREPNNFSEVSMRGHYNDKHHLGEIANRIAKKLNGAGGGHAKASGIRIPTSKISEFLELLKQELTP
ncbi:MAG: DHH family phosphoesterase [Thaumarchaeota archaeon]|nr:DHH family phosphoesterase [Nitrososphaerota archaeon]